MSGIILVIICLISAIICFSAALWPFSAALWARHTDDNADNIAHRNIKSLRDSNRSIPARSFDDIFRAKVIATLAGCSLDAFKVVRYISASNGFVERQHLIRIFGESAVDEAVQSMLLERRDTIVNSSESDPVASYVYRLYPDVRQCFPI